MGATIKGNGQSSLSVTETGITIELPFHVFGKGWRNLVTQLVEVIRERNFILFTPRVMSERDPGPDAPHWKPSSVDVLSWML